MNVVSSANVAFQPLVSVDVPIYRRSEDLHRAIVRREDETLSTHSLSWELGLITVSVIRQSDRYSDNRTNAH